jgi:uncharacterized coiled-coil protein SlyX
MNASEQDPVQPLAERIIRLEELFLHLQRTVQDLDEVVLKIVNRLDALEAGLARIATRTERLSDSLGPDRSLEDERPPHY